MPIKRVGYVQTRPLFGEVELNLSSALSLASRADADLLVFPELFSTGYLYLSKGELTKLAEPIPDGPTSKELMKFAEEHSTAVIAGLAERSRGAFYNSAIIIDERGEFRGVYRKLHLFNEEKLFFDPGDVVAGVHELSSLRVGTMICFDWIFPEVARILALKGAQLVAHPANLVLPYAQTAMLARSIENRVFTVTANRVGLEERNGKKLEFTGMSQITSPEMKQIRRASKAREEVGVAEIDPALADDKDLTDLNNLWRDRRVETYKDLLGAPHGVVR